MICKYCGADIPEGTSFCTSCGAAVEAETAPKTASETVAATPEVVVTESVTEPETNPKAGKTLGIVSLVLGIFSVVSGIPGAFCCACLGSFGSIITSIVGIVLGILSKNKAKAGGAKSTLATVGIILSIIALVGIFAGILLNGVIGFASGFMRSFEDMM